MNFEQHKSTLIAQIHAAFKGVKREGGVTLHEAWLIDCCASDKQRVRARKLDTERRWEDVPASDIENYYSILSFLDPIGFRYYLPAYMVWTLQNYEHSGSTSVDNTIYALNFTPRLREHCMEKFRLFTLEQSAAICAFLTFMATEQEGFADARVAYQAWENYWKRFCANP